MRSALLLVAFALALAGCVGAPSAVLPLFVSALLLFVAGCADSHRAATDGAGTDASSDAGRDAPIGPDSGGTWSACCEGIGADGRGHIASCFCPAGWACNYGLGLATCSDGSCMYVTSGPYPWACPEDVDGGPAPDLDAGTDAGGSWEPCCELGEGGIGVVTTCFCPAGAECNYGLFEYCDDGSCRSPGDLCPG